MERRDGDVVDVEAGRLEDAAGAVGVAGREGARKREGTGALRGGQADVPRRQREPVGVAHRGHDGELELEVQVGDHAAQHLDLLRILLAVEREVGPDGVEELEADRRDAAKVPRAVLALEHCPEPGHVDPRLVPRRVHLVRGRREDDVDARVASDLEVSCLVARVAVQIGGLPELGGVDEEAHHDGVAPSTRGGEQRAVARVQRAHRGHEADRPCAPAGERGADVRDGARDDHGEVPCNSLLPAVSRASSS
ncbi:MAG: hypothetical protein M5U27_04200 [Gaiella sp.]|nr:hypothetical protein [Gaiella sp.]